VERASRLEQWGIPIGVFALALAVYLASPVIVQSDSIWSVPTAASIWLRGDVDLDEYRPAVVRTGSYAVIAQGGHLYGYFPLGASWAAVPFVAVGDLLTGVACPEAPGAAESTTGWCGWREALHRQGDLNHRAYARTERFVASFLTAMAAALIFLVARRMTSLRASLWVAVAFALGSSAYSTSSRVLWQHAPSLLVGSLVLWLVTHPRQSGLRAALTGVAVGCAYVVRPTHSLLVLALTGLFLLTRRRQLPAFLLGGAAVGIPFLVHSFTTYGSWLPPYYLPQRLSPGEGHLLEALAGNLVSPARGLLVYSPIFAFALAAWGIGAVRRRLTATEKALGLVVLGHWVSISSFPHWWGGHSLGPRLFTDVVPWLTFLLIPVVAQAVESGGGRRPRSWALAGALAVSVALHAHAAIHPGVHGWNDGPPSVDDAPRRLWDWSDPPFLRGIARRP